MNKESQTNDNCPAFELAKQLHQQYAEADNNKSHNLIYTIASISVLFTGYGYVFSNCENNISDIITLSLATALIIVILFFLMELTKFHGYSLRRDQVIIYHIRQKYMGEDNMKKFFGNGYNPEKSITEGDILPDHYRIMYNAFGILMFFVIAATISRIILIVSNCEKCCCCRAAQISVFLLILTIITITICLFPWPIDMIKYKNKLNKIISKEKN